ncbi:hypothetical protein AGMMS49992_22230 [Clostridia bacterium]|nr:hypothetical protein AGMMS49992_22230 [Clostridia bacterium]
MEQYSGIAEAMKWAFENGQKVQIADDYGEITDIGGVSYLKYRGKYTPFYAPEEAQPSKIKLTSLTGLTDFILKDPDELFECWVGKYYALIGAQSVRITTQLRGRSKERYTIAECEFTPDRIPFGQWIDAEEMIILLQTRFVKTEALEMVMKIIGNLNQEQAVQTADDGVSQRVTIKSGVAMMSSTTFKNPVPLKPYRTFLEVEQVESPFVLRIKEGGKVALFDADGGMWMLEARENIRKYIDERAGGKVQTVV